MIGKIGNSMQLYTVTLMFCTTLRKSVEFISASQFSNFISGSRWTPNYTKFALWPITN